MYLNPDSRRHSGVSPLPAALRNPGLVLPNYEGSGLFNLAVTLARCCSADVPARYADLCLPDGSSATQAWQSHKTIIFFLVDGLGDDYLSLNRDVAPTLWADRQSSITSVFPSTTATAITTLMTARPAAVHGLLGWFVRDEATGAIVAPLPMRHRAGAAVEDAALISRLLRTRPMLASAGRRASLVTLPELAAGPYSRYHAAGAQLYPYSVLDELPASVRRAVADSEDPHFIYAYTPLLDGTAHEFGIASVEARDVLARVEACYAELRRLIPEALIITSADHGFIDSPRERCIDLTAYPDIYDMLSSPLTGERRVAYCRVKAPCVADFAKRVERILGHALYAVSATEALTAGLFGPADESAKFAIPTGDWLLFARDDWTFYDRLPQEDPHYLLGIHGGLSESEMKIPLIVREPSLM